MPDTLVRRADWRPIPWKNGLGITHELYRLPAGDGFAVRLSAAIVSSGSPFSSFPGIDRALMLLEGSGCTLVREDGLSVTLREGCPFHFHGEDRWSAVLSAGPVLDFNVMVDRRLAHATVLVWEGEWQTPRAPASGGLALLALEPRVTLGEIALDRHDLAVYGPLAHPRPVQGRAAVVLWR